MSAPPFTPQSLKSEVTAESPQLKGVLSSFRRANGEQANYILRAAAPILPGTPLRSTREAREVLASGRNRRLLLPPGAGGLRQQTEALTANLDQAMETAKRGHVFDLGRLTLSSEVTNLAYDQAIAGAIGLPYAESLIVADLTLIETGEENPLGVVAFHVMEGSADGHGGVDGLRFLAIRFFDAGDRVGLMPLGSGTILAPLGGDLAVDRDNVSQDGAVYLVHFLLALLMMIADDRVAAVLHVPDEKLQKARLRRGKPPLASHWKLDGAAGVDLYVTALTGHRDGSAGSSRRGGGAHRSPVPHDRRGHQRRMASGKLVWVRPARIGDLVRHATRRRAFYELHRGV